MRPGFFIDNVRHLLNRRDSEDVLIWFIDNKRKPKSFCVEPRNMSPQRGLQSGFRVVYANTEIDQARTLFDTNKKSRWAYKSISKMPKQYFIVDLGMVTYPTLIRVKMGFDDMDCIKGMHVRASKMPLEFSEDYNDERWVGCFSFECAKSKEWQEFQTDIQRSMGSRYWMFCVTSTYGRFSCLECITLSCPVRLSDACK